VDVTSKILTQAYFCWLLNRQKMPEDCYVRQVIRVPRRIANVLGVLLKLSGLICGHNISIAWSLKINFSDCSNVHYRYGKIIVWMVSYLKLRRELWILC